MICATLTRCPTLRSAWLLVLNLVSHLPTQDPGGLSAAGELPPAMPIWVESERELKGEVDKLVRALDEKQDWTKRIEVLLLTPLIYK